MLIERDDMGVFADNKETIRADSRDVAKMFDKEHYHVVRDIDRLTTKDSGLSSDFIAANFGCISYQDSRNRKQRAYALTRDGFFMTVFGFTGAKAVAVKEAYITRFNEMERQLAALLEARREFPLLTNAVKAAYENPKSYHYSNECDMLNRLVLGMSAAQYKKSHADIPDDAKSIRPYLDTEQIAILDQLQHADIAYLALWPDDYHARFEALLTYLSKHGYEPQWTGPKRKPRK